MKTGFSDPCCRQTRGLDRHNRRHHLIRRHLQRHHVLRHQNRRRHDEGLGRPSCPRWCAGDRVDRPAQRRIGGPLLIVAHHGRGLDQVLFLGHVRRIWVFEGRCLWGR